MKRIQIFGLILITLLLIGGLILASCANTPWCSNKGGCKWTPTGTSATNQSGGICDNSRCVIFDSSKGLEAANQQKTVSCNCN